MRKTIVLDGCSLTPELLYEIGYHNSAIEVSSEAWKRVKEGRQIIDDIIKEGRIVYGINTGFGLFSKVQISPSDLKQLQLNLIRSHSSGVGEYLTIERTRMLLALRINVLAKGHSGVTEATLKKLVSALNNNCISCVPEKGTVGASGDLAPLSHLTLGLLGEGEMWDVDENNNDNQNNKNYFDGKSMKPNKASEVLKKKKFEPLDLQPKEGLALINGTQFITCLGCEALIRAEKIARQCDVVCALTLEGLRGTFRAFEPFIHEARPHKGQIVTAARVRSLLHSKQYPSQISLSHVNCGKVQDAYTLRCIPQVHGVVHDTLLFVRNILTTEMNSATDNPMIFRKDWYPNNSLVEDGTISGGNFHGEYPAKVLDYLAIAIHEIGNMSERRIERLNNPDLNELPAFLVPNGGLNSGFMIAHCTAAALVSENKVLCHPASVDSLSTSGAKEDHVSMGGFAARKAITVVSNVEHIVAIELMCSCQAIDLLRPLTSTEALENVHKVVRKRVAMLKNDKFITPDINQIVSLLRKEEIWNAVKNYISPQFHSISSYICHKCDDNNTCNRNNNNNQNCNSNQCEIKQIKPKL